MSRLKSSLMFLGACFFGFGCAAPSDADLERGVEVDSDTQTLQESRLLALGDSIAFGYNPFGDFTKDKNFEGYPELLASQGGLKNASCPGETSSSFISSTAPDNGCRAYRAAYPLHVNYGNSATQLQYAIARIKSSEPGDVPTQITLNVSGNDIFLLQRQCATAADPAACFQAGAPALIGTIATNVATILGSLRNAGYAGPITYMNLYGTDYTNPSTIAFLTALNGAASAQARNFGAKIADAYGAFQAAAGSQGPCAAGLLIPNPSGGCDVHPSPAGDRVLAQAVRNAQ